MADTKDDKSSYTGEDDCKRSAADSNLSDFAQFACGIAHFIQTLRRLHQNALRFYFKRLDVFKKCLDVFLIRLHVLIPINIGFQITFENRFHKFHRCATCWYSMLTCETSMVSPSFTSFTWCYGSVKPVKLLWMLEVSRLSLVNQLVIILWNLWNLFSTFIQFSSPLPGRYLQLCVSATKAYPSRWG